MSGFNISFAGAGKVAEALCLELSARGHNIEKIFSPGSKNGTDLASKCDAVWSSDPLFPGSTQIIIVAVPDKILPDVLRTIRCNNKATVVHTAGSYGLEVFPDTLKNTGVFYPLQTFSKGRKPYFVEIPVFIESSGEVPDKIIRSLAESLGCSVHLSDTMHRRLLHVAAVFVSNFTNYMFTSGKEISSRAGFSFDVLKPLIMETVKKAIEHGPENSQTGPAVRYDANTIEKHMDLLSFSPELKKVYEEITGSIMNHYKTKTRDE
jgi:predicted short-subunit dehydrogenase-like oxidoreductase (DUF2520 family)